MQAAARPCPEPECRNLTTKRGGCDVHRRQSQARDRAVYDAEWTAFASAYLAKHRLCERCHGRRSAEVHHVVSVAIAPHRRLDPTNVKALCHPCHRAVTPTVSETPPTQRRRRR